MNHIISTFENFLKPTNSFFKFVIVGIINTCIGISISFILLNGFHTGYWPSTFIGNAAGAVVSYILNRKFTFQSKTSVGVSSIRFLAVILISYFVAYSLSSQIINALDLQILTNKESSVLLGACLYTFANYMGQKYFVFTR
ncbi:GtrA family protein [Fictibacillus halophilus]|jgi:putative flippase GtrA|uniref:GtrA family protein n=1 Tax=Fictibacillus halophilus TaxID=1610490 RepID=UPI001CFB2AC3|nr:GtrA family protein [Fictibacillus halophilus]